MKNKATNYNFFIILLCLFAIIGAIVLIKINKGDIVLYCSNHRTRFFNVFFKIATKVVEEHIMIFILAVLLWIRFGTAFMTALAWGVGGVTAQIIKRILAVPRPATYFQDVEPLHFITTSVAYHFSFPSGHTTGAFAVFSMIAFCSKNKWMQALCFFIALAVGFSRVYLLQHFFIDVYVGAILGTTISFGLYTAMEKYAIFGYNNWKEKGLNKKFRF